MADDYFPSRDGPQLRWPRRNSGSEIQYLLGAEEQLLQSISGRAPITEILHKICDALDSEIGNMISAFSLPNDDATGVAAIARSATLFGLHKFCSADVVGGNGELLGSLEMYCSAARRPFLNDVPLIERATYLAAVAIKRHNEAGGEI
jgi:DNA-binding Xre family transcriptional regulator